MSNSKAKSLLELAELLREIKKGYNLKPADYAIQTCLTATWEKFFDLVIDRFNGCIEKTNQAINQAEKIIWPEQKSALEFLLKLREKLNFVLDEMKLAQRVKPAIPANSYEGGAALLQISVIVYKTGLRKYLSKLDNYYASIESEGRIESVRNSGEETDTPVTLREFMDYYCEPVSKNILESRVKSLQSLAQRTDITLGHTGNWKPGQSKKYLPSYLKSNWQTYKGKLISLPNLK